MKTSRSAWIHIVILICTSAQQLKYFTDVNTLGSQCVHSIPWQPVKNGPEDDYLLVETCNLHITLCNKNSCAYVQITITIPYQFFDFLTKLEYLIRNLGEFDYTFNER